MKQVALLTLLGSVLGCASSGQGTGTMAVDKPSRHHKTKAKETNFETSNGAGQMGVENEVGVYEVSDIEDTMSGRMDEVRGCYQRAGHARRYAGGKVTLRFNVDGQGATTDVLVVSTDLGNYQVERCLVDRGRKIKFPPPLGNKATTFEYPVEFRSTHQVEVQDLDDSVKVDHDVATQIHSLASCGALTQNGGEARFYIEPTGTVGSVGLAADSTLNEDAPACMVKEMSHGHMPATLRGRMLRCRVNTPAVIASAEP